MPEPVRVEALVEAAATDPPRAVVRQARGRHRAKGPGGSGFLARAAFVTAGLTAAGAVFGLVRDQILADSFGAGADSDAFLVAWTVPEFASTLLIEDAMALILVPAFSRALLRRDGAPALVRATLPRLVVTVAAAALLLVVLAPPLVAVLAPGLPDPQLAVDCTRLTATCVLSFALTGYCSAALRAHGRFLPPATIYVAYNIGIVSTVLVLREPLGVRSAAVGVAVGGTLMVLVQAPFLVRALKEPRTPAPADGPPADPAGPLVVLALVAPVVAFAVTRQSQVLVERFLAAPLPSGAISHLNYAQKIAQMPMILSLMLCTVTFPVVARAVAAGEREAARRRVERDLLLAVLVVLAGASVVIGAAPQIVAVLFERGAFDRADTGATAAVMRVYALGLLGQTLVGVLVRCYFSAARPLWFPAATMLAGLAATALAGAFGVRLWGVLGIAGANALGITLTAVLLLTGSGRQSVPLGTGRVAAGVARLAATAAAATTAAWLCAAAVTAAAPPGLAHAAGIAAACAVTALVLLPSAARAVRAPGAPSPFLPPLFRPVARRLAHVRCHGPRPRPHPAPPAAADAAPVGGDVPLDRGRPR
ncbi:lipid II flippase MurJ [Streptomyces tritici]|uniref:lipid II flippase MurJ n=1 Tax=Streptomyces tritici TaxID=2054410 RepID=UPI003AEF2ECF